MRKYPFITKRKVYLNLKRYICRIWFVKKNSAIGARVWEYPCKPDAEHFNCDIDLKKPGVSFSGQFKFASPAFIWTWQTQNINGGPPDEHLHIEVAK